MSTDKAPADRVAPAERAATADPSAVTDSGSRERGSRGREERSRYREWRDGIASRPTVDRAYRIAVAAVGTVVLALGILAIPYPGPGWLIVFAGLGILASEFAWAKTVLHWVRARYDTFMEWFGRQNIVVKGLGALLTTVVVLATLWLLGALELVAGWVGLDWAWLQSPL